VEVVQLSHDTQVVTKRYEDERILQMHVVDGVIVEKSMTFKWDWDMPIIKQQKENGADKMNYRHYAKAGFEVDLTYFGTYLVGMVGRIDYTVVKPGKVAKFTVEEELENDIDFPMVNISKVTTIEGWSADEMDNPMISDILIKQVYGALSEYEKELAKGGVSSGNKTADLIQCESCGEVPCVWVRERETVIANDRTLHNAQVTNNLRRKAAYQHMFRVTNGLGQKGVRVQHPECIESGVRSLYPDAVFMGFKEE
jgi:hypothetical protein